MSKSLFKVFLFAVVSCIFTVEPFLKNSFAIAQSSNGLAGEAPYDWDSMKPIFDKDNGNVNFKFYGCIRNQKETVKCIWNLTRKKEDRTHILYADRTFYVNSSGQRINSNRATFGISGEKDNDRRVCYPEISIAAEYYFSVPESTKILPIAEFFFESYGEFGYNPRFTQILIR